MNEILGIPLDQYFHQACQNIVDNADAKALNYCVGYAKAGLKMHDKHYILAQVPYLLSNMTHWRGPIARETKSILKNIQRYYS